jgi:hypothetical protein
MVLAMTTMLNHALQVIIADYIIALAYQCLDH